MSKPSGSFLENVNKSFQSKKVRHYKNSSEPDISQVELHSFFTEQPYRDTYNNVGFAPKMGSTAISRTKGFR